MSSTNSVSSTSLKQILNGIILSFMFSLFAYTINCLVSSASSLLGNAIVEVFYVTAPFMTH